MSSKATAETAQNMKKQCWNCKKTKLISDFGLNRGRPMGICKLCARARYASSKNTWIEKASKKYNLGIGTLQRYGVKFAVSIYERAGRKCEFCSDNKDLTIHHLDRIGRNIVDTGGKANNDPENLIVLCRRCHGTIHGYDRANLNPIDNGK